MFWETMRVRWEGLAWSTGLCGAGKDKGFSFPKLVILPIVWVTVYDIVLNGYHAVHNVSFAMCITAAFGRSEWRTWLTRNEWKSNTETSVTISGSLKDLVRRRDPIKGIEDTSRVPQVHDN